MMVLKLLQHAVVAPCFMTDATQYYISHYYTYFYINNQRLTCSLVTAWYSFTVWLLTSWLSVLTGVRLGNF